MLQITFSYDFLVGAIGANGVRREPAMLHGDARLAMEYEELVGCSKLETI
jgi:hypothetical protein